MFPLRRAALRLLSSPSASFVARSRTVTTFSNSPIRSSRQTPSIHFQRRWATNEAEVKKEEEVPISQIQPTASEEVENAISQDNAAQASSAAPAVAEPANTTAATEEASATKQEPTDVQSAFNSVKASVTDTVSGVASKVQETLTEATGAAASVRSSNEPPTPKPTIYIGNLFFDVTENDLVKELSRFGTIKRARLIRDARGLSKGFGYVEFEDIESATRAKETMNQQLFEGRRLNVQYATQDSVSPSRSGERRPQKPLNPPSKTLFIGNMSFEMTDRDLTNLFRGIRNVIDVRVAIDRRTGQPRGFAHADFIDVKSAVDAMKVLQGKEAYGRNLRVDYSYGPSTAPRNTRGDGPREYTPRDRDGPREYKPRDGSRYTPRDGSQEYEPRE